MNIADIASKTKLHKPQIVETKRANAVLVPLMETENGVCLLFETRSENVWQPGEVCFPGGGVESGETPAEAAVRECCEETGVRPSDIELISQFDTVVALGGFVLDSFIAKITASEFNIDPKEVTEVFTVPLDWFMTHEPREFEFPLKVMVPEDFDYSVFGVSGPYNWRKSFHKVCVWKYENHYIWGLTAKIVKQLLTFLENN